MEILTAAEWAGIAGMTAIVFAFVGVYLARPKEKIWLFIAGALTFLFAGTVIGSYLQLPALQNAAFQQKTQTAIIGELSSVQTAMPIALQTAESRGAQTAIANTNPQFFQSYSCLGLEDELISLNFSCITAIRVENKGITTASDIFLDFSMNDASDLQLLTETLKIRPVVYGRGTSELVGDSYLYSFETPLQPGASFQIFFDVSSVSRDAYPYHKNDFFISVPKGMDQSEKRKLAIAILRDYLRRTYNVGIASIKTGCSSCQDSAGLALFPLSDVVNFTISEERFEDDTQSSYKEYWAASVEIRFLLLRLSPPPSYVRIYDINDRSADGSFLYQVTRGR